MATKINIFEGSRRLAVLLGGLWVAGWSAMAVFDSPYVSVTYKIPLPLMKPTFSAQEDCEREDAVEYVTVTTNTGRAVSAKVCFSAIQMDDGRFFIPTTINPNTQELIGDTRYSPRVTAYTQAASTAVRPSPSEQRIIETIYETKRREQIVFNMKMAAAGVFFLWIATFIVGWIVRGFLGIPTGTDSIARSDHKN